MNLNFTEHKFLADFQPLGGDDVPQLLVGTVLNWCALFGVFYVIGAGLRLGLGI